MSSIFVADTISVLGGGWSASRYRLSELPGFVIGVNDAIFFGRCDACVSMDRLWVENRWEDLLRLNLPSWLRNVALVNIPSWPPWVTRFRNDHKSSKMVDDDPAILNGTNSGLCALNLAYQFHPETIKLYGMDGSRGPKGERHWYPPYPWANGKGTSQGTFNNWRKDLADAVKQCERAHIRVELMT